MLPRTLEPEALRILSRWGKMVFISGPRQVGKTTVARHIQKGYPDSLYFSWDLVTDQRRLARDPYFFDKEARRGSGPRLLVFDEIHKYRRWKSYLKGVYDGFREDHRVLVTGSGRLDLYRKGGESLLGRYMGLPLFPLTAGELLGNRPSWRAFEKALRAPSPEARNAGKTFDRLFEFSGFPEPYVRRSKEFYRAWSSSRSQLLVREDIRDATNIRQISLVEMLVQLLEPRVGGLLSINSLREDLGVAFETVRDWLQVLEDFYLLFRVRPHEGTLTRLLRKETKLYLYDWRTVEAPPARFENLVALHLLKAVRTGTALGHARMELRYVRDKEKREVDFLVMAEGKPALLVECKVSEANLSPHLLYFQERLNVPVAVQLLLEKGHDREWRIRKRTQRVISADRWLALLP